MKERVRKPARERRLRKSINGIRRAFEEFLALPTLIIAGFLGLAATMSALDRQETPGLERAGEILESQLFPNAQATADLLGIVAGGIITVTSITISLLLLALQQVASALTAEVYDQFLRRRHNQFYFGFFVGLALYSLTILATVNEGYNPVFSAAVALLFTGIALYLLLVLLYTTIDQMRPIQVIRLIERLVLAARTRQLDLIRRSRSSAIHVGAARQPIMSQESGYVTGIDLDSVAAAAIECGPEVEVVLRVSIGSYVAFQDVVAEVTAGPAEHNERLEHSVCAALRIEEQRDLASDPAHGIQQLESMAWTSISTSKSDPGPGLMVIQSLRNLLAHWANEDSGTGQVSQVPVVYVDTVPAEVMNAIESLAVVSTESMQHQTLAEILRSLAAMFGRLPPALQSRTEDMVLRVLSGLGDHILTVPLDLGLSDLTAAFANRNRTTLAAAVRRARDTLALSVGTINSRATRLKG